MNEDRQIHFFASCAFGWATAETRHDAIVKLVASFRSDVQRQIVAGRKHAQLGFYVWSTQVNEPADASYSIEWFQPKGVETEDGQESTVIRAVGKSVEYFMGNPEIIEA